MSAAWKDLERRVCALLGGRRGGHSGESVIDCVKTPIADEVKRTTRPGPPYLSKRVLQAKTNGRREGRPWLVVVAGHNDRRPIACLDLYEFAELAQKAGVIPTPIDVAATSEEEP